jgi:2',3'-cyclic-nucleotide 2'-phosphodiesterase (5'-nucleotidase family)
VVDAGNYVDRQGTGGCSNKCQFVVTSYKDLHYDVLNLGRQEVWMGYETLRAMLDTIQGTEFVSANLLDLKTKKPLAKPYVIKNYGTLRVGVIGLLNEGDFPKGTTLLDTTRLMIQPYMDAAKKYIPALSRKVDAVVLICELPSAALDTLLKVVPDIDLVISTGALRNGESPVVVGKTRIVGSGASGYTGHYAMLEFNPAWADSIGFRQYQDALSDAYDEKGAWADRVAAFNAAPPPSAKPAAAVAPKKLDVTPTKDSKKG